MALIRPGRFVPIAALALVSRAFCQHGAPLFDNAQYLVGKSPQAVATADLNNDGRLDLITANLSSNNVSVLLADGLGGFGAASHYDALAEPRGLAMGDCNEDGRPDVAVACSGANGFAILLGNGTGGFGSPAGYNAGTAPHGIVLADFDRDGHLDTATADSGSGNSVFISHGDGQGGFLAAIPYQAGPDPRSLTAGDFNSDGWTDIAALNDAAGISVLLNVQDGTFASAITYPAGSSPRRSLQAADVTGDGILDLALVLGLGGGVLLVGNGDGSFQLPSTFAIGANSRSLALGDLNQDGINDIAGCSQSPPTLRIHWGTSTGNLISGPSMLIAGDPLGTVIGDFNQDGITEIATVNGQYADNVSVFLRNSQGNFLPTPRYPIGDSPRGLIAGDWNQDGFPDLASTRWALQGKLLIALNDGAGGFLPVTEWPVGSNPTHLAAADLDHDGRLDVVVANYTEHTLSILKGVGGGNFASGATLSVGGLFPAFVALADVDGNGWIDIVNTNHVSDDVSVFLGSGAGTFAPASRYAAGIQPISVAIGDLNADGMLDLAVTDDNPNTVSVLTGDGAGGFQVTQVVPTSPAPHRIAIIDHDQDGRQDLVVTCRVTSSTASSLELFHQDTNGVFQTVASYPAGYAVLNLALGDLNGDGLRDVITASALSSDVFVYLSDGQGGFLSTTGYVVGPIPDSCGTDPHAVAVADYNSDGRLDLATVAACGGNTAIAVLPNRLSYAPGVPMCFGDALGGVCPCGNQGSSGHGCDNSIGGGGALLEAAGQASISGDLLSFTSSGELPNSLTIFIQGSAFLDHASFGDGLRCVGGQIKRLYTKFASGGIATAPQAGDPAVSTRSAITGDPLSIGSIRVYQAYYRDPQLSFCSNPAGNSFNVSSGQQVVWQP